MGLQTSEDQKLSKDFELSAFCSAADILSKKIVYFPTAFSLLASYCALSMLNPYPLYQVF